MALSEANGLMAPLWNDGCRVVGIGVTVSTGHGILKFKCL